jgi:hypothetical protein
MTKELSKPTFIPEVVDERGNKIVGPELEAVTGLVTQMAQLAQLAKIRKSLEREHFEGKVVEETLAASSSPHVWQLLREYPYVALATVYFKNDDDSNPVYISINNAYDWKKVDPQGEYSVDFLKADRRVELIYYKCDAGGTASVRVAGKY